MQSPNELVRIAKRRAFQLLPSGIRDVTSLDLSDCMIQSLSSHLFSKDEDKSQLDPQLLEKFLLSNNQISNFPSSIVPLFPKLRQLSLKGNQFQEWPPAICDLPVLEILDISRNMIRSMPDNFGNLMQLKVLCLSRNRIRSLPQYLVQMKQLRVLRIDHNPIENSSLSNVIVPEATETEEQWLERFKNVLATSSNSSDKKAIIGRHFRTESIDSTFSNDSQFFCRDFEEQLELFLSKSSMNQGTSIATTNPFLGDVLTLAQQCVWSDYYYLKIASSLVPDVTPKVSFGHRNQLGPYLKQIRGTSETLFRSAMNIGQYIERSVHEISIDVNELTVLLANKLSIQRNMTTSIDNFLQQLQPTEFTNNQLRFFRDFLLQWYRVNVELKVISQTLWNLLKTHDVTGDDNLKPTSQSKFGSPVMVRSKSITSNSPSVISNMSFEYLQQIVKLGDDAIDVTVEFLRLLREDVRETDEFDHLKNIIESCENCVLDLSKTLEDMADMSPSDTTNEQRRFEYFSTDADAFFQAFRALGLVLQELVASGAIAANDSFAHQFRNVINVIKEFAQEVGNIQSVK